MGANTLNSIRVKPEKKTKKKIISPWLGLAICPFQL